MLLLFGYDNDINDSVGIDFENIMLYHPVKDNSKFITDDILDEVDEIEEFFSETKDYLFPPFLSSLYNYLNHYPSNMANKDYGSISWFFHTFYSYIKKNRYYENIAGDFCDQINKNNDFRLYFYIDDIDLIVYDHDKKDFFIKVEDENNESIVTLYEDYKKTLSNPLDNKYKEEILNSRKNYIDKYLDIARNKGVDKNLVFLIVFKFVTTIRHYPLAIIDSKNLKLY